MTAADDPGSPVSYIVLATGTPVFSADGRRIGTVGHVLADEREDIFDGIVVGDLDHDVVGPGERHRFVDAPEIAAIHERAVTLSLDSAACRNLPAPSPSPGQLAADPSDHASALGAKLRRAWDILSGDR